VHNEREMKFSVTDVVLVRTSLRAALAMVPSFCQEATGASRIVYLVTVLLIAYASSIWFSIANR
jgi:hypothetical protein